MSSLKARSRDPGWIHDHRTAPPIGGPLPRRPQRCILRACVRRSSPALSSSSSPSRPAAAIPDTRRPRRTKLFCLTPRASTPTSFPGERRRRRLEGAPGVDIDKLSLRERGLFWDLVSQLYAPCTEQAVSIAQCVQESRPCAACRPAATLLADKVHQGATAEEGRSVYATRFGPNLKKVDVADSPAKGPADAPVTIMVWSDFQCPHCRLALPMLDGIFEKFSPKVRLVHKFYPLHSHTTAEPSARAAIAAQNQGHYWEMERLLFGHQDAQQPGISRTTASSSSSISSASAPTRPPTRRGRSWRGTAPTPIDRASTGRRSSSSTAGSSTSRSSTSSPTSRPGSRSKSSSPANHRWPPRRARAPQSGWALQPDWALHVCCDTPGRSEFNAKAQRRKGAKDSDSPLRVFASLRLRGVVQLPFSFVASRDRRLNGCA